MGKRGLKYQVNLFRRKRRCAPFHPMGRGFFMPSRRESGTKLRGKK